MYQLVVQQLRGGARPVVHTMRWPRSLATRELIDGSIPVRRHSYRVPEGSVRRMAVAGVCNPFVLGAIVRQLRADRTDLVHLQCVSSGSWFAYQAARLLRLPIVVTLQGELTMDAEHVYERSPLLRRTLRTLLREADAVTGCSRAVLDEAESWVGFDFGHRARVVFNGVDVAQLQSPIGADPLLGGVRRPYVLAIGRHVEQKGFDVLIDAFHRLVSDPAFEWDLVLAGDGPEHARLIADTDRLGLGDRVRIVGPADRSTAIALFNHAACFVLPSRQEPFGIVNLEAIAAGSPVVATRVGGVPEFLSDGKSALLVDPDDPLSLMRAIRRIHDDPSLRTRLISEGKRLAELFDWPIIERRYREVYAEARERRSAGAP